MKDYCMSLFLTFRFVKDISLNFFPGLTHTVYDKKFNTASCRTAQDLGDSIRKTIEKELAPGASAVFLSGGIDSAIVASYLPKGTKAYTFKCLAPDAIDETPIAKKYADTYNLDHEIIEIRWEDFESFTPEILKYNQVPVHSIEIQLYKAALLAKSAGIQKVFIGESADLIYGGMDRLLSKDWKFEEFINRYTFVEPSTVLRLPKSTLNVFLEYKSGDGIDLLRFMDEIFAKESSTSYMHAFNMVGMPYLDPYAYTSLAEPLNLKRIRNGEPKYLVRELFRERYPSFDVPDKIPMPRSMDYWLKGWTGPKRDEFIPGSQSGLDGDQKWLVYCLEKYLDIFDKSFS